MANVERLGRDRTTGRELYVLQLDTLEKFPSNLSLSSPKFICLLAWDARRVDDLSVRRLVRKLLDVGAVYISVWGPDCERVHDLIDQEAIGQNPTEPVDSVIMTAWHSDEPLTEAIWSVLHCSWPDQAFEADCTSALGVAIGEPSWAGKFRAAFGSEIVANTQI